jgi:predicted ATPase
MTEAGVARRNVGVARLWQGDFIDAEAYLAEALRTYDPERDSAAKFRFGADIGAGAAGYRTLASWALGDVKRARALSEEALARADEAAHAPTRANVCYFISLYHMLRRDPEAAWRIAKIPVELGREHGMALYLAWGEVLSHWARARLGDRDSGMMGLREALAAYLRQGNKLYAPLFQGRLAELEVKGDDAEAGLTRIDGALALANETGERWTDALLHRIRGAILLKRDPANTAPAEEAFLAAIAIAQAQKARSFELQAALALAKLYQSIGRPAEAHAVLAPALEGFSPTPEMPEIAEAQTLLSALAETEEVKAVEAQRLRRLHLQTTYGQAMMMTKGYAAQETRAAFARAAELAGGIDDFSERFTALGGQTAAAMTGGELRLARELALTVLREAEETRRIAEAGLANQWLGLIAYWRGDFLEARTHYERAVAARDPSPDLDLLERFGDPGTFAASQFAPTAWALGEVERARELINTGTQRAWENGHIGAIADALFYKSYLEVWRNDPAATLSVAEALERVAREHGIAQYLNEAELHSGWARGRITDPAAGAAEIQRVLAAFVEQGVRVNLGFYTGLLAELEAETLEAESALARIDEAFRLSEQVEHRCSLPFLHRLRGEILLKRDPANPAPAEEAFRTSIAIAKEQSARSPVLLASLALARLLQSTGRPVEAHAVLAPALEGFSPTPEMPEIAEAKALLEALAETEEVRAAEAQRQRRAHLQTAYGQAMMWAKGFSAEETRAAFSRATEIAAKTDSFADRFAAAHGQWLFALVRGELQSTRQLASAFLKEAEATGRAVEAGVARRGLAHACYQAGDFLDARTHCDRALEVYDPEDERETQERFQNATGPLVMSVLAVTMWQLGEVGRARELIEQSIRRAGELGHAPLMARPLAWKSHFEILRGDPAAALIAAEALEGLGQQHGLPFYRTMAELSVAWARGRLHDTATGAEDLRRVLADRIEQGALSDAWFYKGLLAELEAETLGADSALGRIEEAMALARQVENRCNLPFLHLLRGKLLLERDPSDPAPAEEAFLTALEIAKQQGARSWGLRAALSLARLYQSTARPVDAHVVLAPALEGFAPTPEMREIVEAQALLAALHCG